MKFRINSNKNSTDLESFLTECAIFINSDAWSIDIMSPLKLIHRLGKNSESICEATFLSRNGYPLPEQISETVKRLLQHDLVKYSADRKYLIPYHDSYKEAYRIVFNKTFALSSPNAKDNKNHYEVIQYPRIIKSSSF